jgi:hypothetical protein
LQESCFFLHACDRYSEVIGVGIDAEWTMGERGESLCDFIISDRAVGHFRRIAGIDAFRYEAQRPDAIAPDRRQQVERPRAFRTLPRGNFVSDRLVIHLDSVALNQARVAQRVSEGGHSVPEEKVASRIPRTLTHLKTALPLCDEVRVLDNSSADDPYRPVFTIKNGVIHRQLSTLPDWAEKLLVE